MEKTNMTYFDEARISKAILDSYHRKLSKHILGDVVFVGAGPSGLLAAGRLAKQGYNVVVVEKRLSPGGGVWGGAMCMNDVAIQEEALPILEELGVRNRPEGDGLYTADAMELASALCLYALQSGATILNMMTVEDICVRDNTVTGVVINRTLGPTPLPIDPLMLTASAVVDGTGHDCVMVHLMQKRGLLEGSGVSANLGDGIMNVVDGEQFVVDKVSEIYPGLWICGMAVCAAYGGPRMGPIFGGMLLSGARVAEQIAKSLQKKQTPQPVGAPG